MRTFQSVLSQPGIMSFGAGLMNPAGFDVAGVRSALAIVERMAALEVPARAEELVVTTGATQALDVLIRALLDPGDVAVADPSVPAGVQR